jgi:hypothetical protein
MLPTYWREFLSLIADLRSRTVAIWATSGCFETKPTGGLCQNWTAYGSFLKNQPPYGSSHLGLPCSFASFFSQSWTLYAFLGGQFMRLLSVHALSLPHFALVLDLSQQHLSVDYSL